MKKIAFLLVVVLASTFISCESESFESQVVSEEINNNNDTDEEGNNDDDETNDEDVLVDN